MNYTKFLLLFISSLPFSLSAIGFTEAARRLCMPNNIFTDTYHIRWDGWSPLPKVKAAQEVRNEIKNTNFERRFPGKYLGSLGHQTNAEYVKEKLQTVMNSPTNQIDKKRALLFEYGPLCPFGRLAVRSAHTLPWSPFMTAVKYMVIIHYAHELYQGAQNIKQWYKTSS